MAEIIRPVFKKSSHTPRRDLPDRKAPIVRDDETGEKEYCSHEFVALLTRSRVVVCRRKDCRQQIDAFSVLKRLALQWENATWLDNEIKQRHERIEELKRIEANVKARIRRAGGTVPHPWALDSMIRSAREKGTK